MKITTNFQLKEFTDRPHELLTPIQRFMLLNLCSILECIRSFLSEALKTTIPLVVSSGIRLPSDTNKLRNAGNNPSETSDHLFGNIVKLRSKVKIKMFGRYYVYSVGAADVVPVCGATDAFQLMLPYFNRQTGEVNLPGGTIKVGQIILEKKDNSDWLHVSNPWDLVYSGQMVASFFNRKHFLTSVNNGESYESV